MKTISQICRSSFLIPFAILFILILTPALQAQNKSLLKGKYFGQKPPGLKMEKFNNGVLVGDKYSFNVAFSPDHKELFFSYYKARPERPHPEYEIKTYKLVDNIWQGPETAFFSGKYSDVDISFSPDGKYLFFASDRPHPESGGLDIYYLKREAGGWSQPIYAGTEVNTAEGEVLPCLSNKGNLFFRSGGRPGGYGSADIYQAEWIDGKFTNVTNLGPTVNTEYSETDPFVAQDESYLVYDTVRPDNENIPQIWVTFKTENNTWTKGVSISDEINTKEGASAPTISPDGKYLFFKRREGRDRGIHWISTEIIANLKKKILEK